MNSKNKINNSGCVTNHAEDLYEELLETARSFGWLVEENCGELTFSKSNFSHSFSREIGVFEEITSHAERLDDYIDGWYNALDNESTIPELAEEGVEHINAYTELAKAFELVKETRKSQKPHPEKPLYTPITVPDKIVVTYEGDEVSKVHCTWERNY